LLGVLLTNLYLKEVTSKLDLNRFIKFPLKLYKDHPYYVPGIYLDELTTLSPEKNPAFEDCEARYWLAYKNKKVVGRIAGIINYKHIQKWQQPYMRFGWFDTIDDIEVSTLLLGAVETWAFEKDLTAVHCPLGFSDLDREGMLIEGFDQLGTLATLYNYAYYPKHLARLGYKKDIDWVEYQITIPEELDPRITRAAETVLSRNSLTMPILRKKQELLKYAPDIFGLINSEYSHLYGAVPLSQREIDHYVNTYFNFVDPDYVPIILDKDEKVIAFGVTIPSLSKALQKCNGKILPLGWLHLLNAIRKPNLVDLYLIAVKEQYQGLGVNLVLMERIYQVLRNNGIKYVESNPELETNLNVQSQWKIFETHQHKRRRCFIKNI
jgi:GNAT superfamily N-acetyltransferase